MVSHQFWRLGCWRDLFSTFSLNFSWNHRLGVCLNFHLLYLSQWFPICLNFSINKHWSNTIMTVYTCQSWLSPDLWYLIRGDSHSSTLCVLNCFWHILKCNCLSVIIKKGKFISTFNRINIIGLNHRLTFTLTTLLKNTQFIFFLKALCDLICSLNLFH